MLAMCGSLVDALSFSAEGTFNLAYPYYVNISKFNKGKIVPICAVCNTEKNEHNC